MSFPLLSQSAHVLHRFHVYLRIFLVPVRSTVTLLPGLQSPVSSTHPLVPVRSTITCQVYIPSCSCQVYTPSYPHHPVHQWRGGALGAYGCMWSRLHQFRPERGLSRGHRSHRDWVCHSGVWMCTALCAWESAGSRGGRSTALLVHF